jgi:hypothetical protein
MRRQSRKEEISFKRRIDSVQLKFKTEGKVSLRKANSVKKES